MGTQESFGTGMRRKELPSRSQKCRPQHSRRCERYRRYAERFSIRDGVPIGTYNKVALLMKSLGKVPDGRVAARDFGSLALKAVQHRFAAESKVSRPLNDLVDIARRCFKWAVSDEPCRRAAITTKADLGRLRPVCVDTFLDRSKVQVG